jgi:hypothetical protein
MIDWLVTYERADGCCGGRGEATITVRAPNASYAVSEARALLDYEARRILSVQRKPEKRG